MTAALLLLVYWFLFRRQEAKLPWLIFVGTAISLTASFLAARFLLAPPAHNLYPLTYFGGSFDQVLIIQPRLWAFMIGQLVWPINLSADYSLDSVGSLATLLAFPILITFVALQGWLAWKSRIGALGVGVYWLGLLTVSNFVPLYCIVADRYYY